MHTTPLVSVICLCYNHERFLAEALDSVLAQTYPNLEIIIVDDCSTDNSVRIITAYVQQFPQLKFISTGQNTGNCATFNKGWQASQGEFILDFATDDVLLPNALALQVAAFRKHGNTYGVVYADAAYMNDTGKHLYLHSQKYAPAPDGNVFAEVIRRYFICAPTMMMRRQVLETLGGYDENLYYEDFDFWIRSSRVFAYLYVPEPTIKRRLHAQSMSQQWYAKGDLKVASNVTILQKAMALVQTPAEKAALHTRLKYEVRQAYFSDNFEQATAMIRQLRQINPALPLAYKVIEVLNKYSIRLSVLRTLYMRVRWR